MNYQEFERVLLEEGIPSKCILTLWEMRPTDDLEESFLRRAAAATLHQFVALADVVLN